MATPKKSTKSKAKKSITLADVKKGDTVYLFMFSGAAAGRDSNGYEVAACNEKTIMVETKSGKKKFSRATGVQIGADRPRYSNFITADVDDTDAKEAAKDIIRGLDAGEPPAPRKANKAAPKTKKAAEPEEDLDEDEYEDAEEAPAPKKKAPAKKKPAAKKKAAPPPEEDEDEDEFDDDDFDEDDE